MKKLQKSFQNAHQAKKGGELGMFKKGDMVKEFDDVVFSKDLNKIHGPVKTQFGFHLIEITGRI